MPVLVAAALALLPLAALAQPDRPDLRWTLYAGTALDYARGFNARGLEHVLRENGFGDTGDGFFGEVDYPFNDTDVDPLESVSLLAAYTFRHRLSVGLQYHRAVKTEVTGFSSSSGRVALKQTMWAAGPAALWRPRLGVLLGGGAVLARGETSALRNFGRDRVGTQTFTRLGLTLLGAVGLPARDGRFLLGIYVQALLLPSVNVGPFDRADIEATRANPSQIMAGPTMVFAF